MSATFAIFCKTSVRGITAAELASDLHEVDLYTVAEGFGFDDEDVVDSALAQLAVQSVPTDDAQAFEIRYRPTPARPLVLSIVADFGAVATYVTDAVDELAGDPRAEAGQVRSELHAVVEVAFVELGIASRGRGVIRDVSDEWWLVVGERPTLLLGTTG